MIPPTQRPNESLPAAFRQARERTRRIFALVAPEAYYERPIPLRHPIAFYDGHLAAFNWNTLFRRVLGEASFNPAFDALFERGIDPHDEAAAGHHAIAAWPSYEEIQAYKARITERFDTLLHDLDVDGTPGSLKDGKLLNLLLEHELMHQETLLYLIHQLPEHLKLAPCGLEPPDRGHAPAPRMVEVPGGMAVLGARPSEVAFGWDNEFPRTEVSVPPFVIDAYNVTNGEYAAFVAAGGYQRAEFWSPESFAWLQAHGIEHPHYWVPRGTAWGWKDFFETVPLPSSAPVYVTHAEATAYARFVGKALPTEAEWHRAAFGDHATAYPWGEEPPGPEHGNFGFQHGSTTRVGAFPAGASGYGVHDLVGNGWEWTSTPFGPFPGFHASEDYPLYSVDFFDGAHFVMKGGSCFTDPRLLRRSFRNWFYGHYPYMYATFRCVEPR